MVRILAVGASRPQWLPDRGDGPGVALAVLIGGAALLASRTLPKSPFLSDILLALVAGALILNTPAHRLVGLARPGPEREPDRYASGLRWVGKWVLRLSIVLMGLRVRSDSFHGAEIALIGGVLAAALPSTFLVAHAAGSWLGLRRAMSDLLAGGTMICGASAVNAIAPVTGAHRGEQGVATAAIFMFSVVALLLFHPVAQAVGLDASHAGMWSGLAVNDLSSAIAVGKQMGGDGGVMAAASKSVRVLLLAPLLLILALLRAGRQRPGAADGIRSSALALVPGYLFGYIGLALVRFGGDRLWGGQGAWTGLLDSAGAAGDFCLLSVAAGIGLHLDLRTVLGAGTRALVAAGAASVWMAALALVMITLAARGAPSSAALAGVSGVIAAAVLWRIAAGPEVAARLLETRFANGSPLNLAEATSLLDRRERQGASLDEETRRRLLRQLHPSIGELIPARESRFRHGDGSRWLTYWQGTSGWALVAVLRDPGATTPIHAHPHRLLAKTIEGSVEELRFREVDGEVELVERHRPAHDELVEADGLATVHAIRTLGPRPAIDLQLRGPEQGPPGRRLRALGPLDLATLTAGQRIPVQAEVDDRPGHRGEGPAAATVLPL